MTLISQWSSILYYILRLDQMQLFLLSLSIELTIGRGLLFFIVYSSADDEDSLDLPSFLEVMGRQNQAQTGQTAVGKCDQLLTFLNHSVVIFNEAGHEKTGLDHSKYPKLYNLSVKLFQCRNPTNIIVFKTHVSPPFPSLPLPSRPVCFLDPPSPPFNSLSHKPHCSCYVVFFGLSFFRNTAKKDTYCKVGLVSV